MAWNLISKELEKLRTPQQEPEKEKFEGNGEGVRLDSNYLLQESVSSSNLLCC